MQTASVARLDELHRPHRSRIEMRAAILRAVRTETSPTRVMRRANLSWNLLSGFLPGMVARGLIRESTASDRRSYSLTSRGSDVLRLFELVRQELSEPGDSKAWTLDDHETIRSTDDFFDEIDRFDKMELGRAPARLTVPAETA